uniref:RWP-RK domain-containing protein n=1 Tax=Lotus japonicus TaxID=34305 RepID=I3S376_LOTJA|nr:unknown [Lotus japonicus]
MEEEEKLEKMPMPLALMLPSSSSSKVRGVKSSSRKLEFAEIKKHFGVKITEVAKNMNVGLTHLKKRCRELKIMRWPHKKLKSLNSRGNWS